MGQKSSIYPKIHNFKISFFTKFTFSKAHFWQNSHFQSLIFDKIHIFKISCFTKFSFSKSHFSQNSHIFNQQILGNFWIKSWFLPQCALVSFTHANQWEMSWCYWQGLFLWFWAKFSWPIGTIFPGTLEPRNSKWQSWRMSWWPKTSGDSCAKCTEPRGCGTFLVRSSRWNFLPSGCWGQEIHWFLVPFGSNDTW